MLFCGSLFTDRFLTAFGGCTSEQFHPLTHNNCLIKIPVWPVEFSRVVAVECNWGLKVGLGNNHGSLLLTQYSLSQLVLTACSSLYVQLVPITYTCIWMMLHTACNIINDVSIFWSRYCGCSNSATMLNPNILWLNNPWTFLGCSKLLPRVWFCAGVSSRD